MDIYKDIVGYESLYRINRCGLIVSSYKNKKTLKPATDKDGYLRVTLVKDGTNKCHYVHRLVARTFIEDNSIKQVNHKNGIKNDNRVDNLEWVTCQENIKHCINTLGLRIKPVEQCNKCGDVIKVWSSIKKASEGLNIKPQHIWRVCNNIRKLSGGFMFRYNLNNPTDQKNF